MSVTVAAAIHIRRLSSSSAENSSNKQVTVVDDDPKVLHSPKNKWAPFESKEEFNLDVTLLLIFIVCFVLGAFLLNYLINRFVNIGFGDRSSADDHNDHDNMIKNREINKASGPTLEFSKGIKMAGTEAVCAICLSEFVEGEKIRVLPKCNHGFHFKCIEKWLLNFKTSCPTCRTNCLNSSPYLMLPPTTTTAVFIDEDVVEVESGIAAAEAELTIVRASDHHHHEEGGTTTTTTESGSSSSAAAE